MALLFKHPETLEALKSLGNLNYYAGDLERGQIIDRAIDNALINAARRAEQPE